MRQPRRDDLNTTLYPQSEVEPLVNRYLHYLRNERGLAKNSVLVYAPFVRRLLIDQVAKTGGVSVDAFDATSIRTFLLEHIHGRSAEYARLLATALRSFFRFCSFAGIGPQIYQHQYPLSANPAELRCPLSCHRKKSIRWSRLSTDRRQPDAAITRFYCCSPSSG